MSDTLEYLQHYLTQPTRTPKNFVLHVLQTLACALEDAPIQMCDEQLRAISALHKIFGHWWVTGSGDRFSAKDRKSVV